MKKSLIVILALALVFAFSATALAADNISWTVNGSPIINGGSQEITDFSAPVSFGVTVTNTDTPTPAVITDVAISATAGATLSTASTGSNPDIETATLTAGKKEITLKVDYKANGVDQSATINITLYMGSNNTDLNSVTLTPNGTNGKSTVSINGTTLYGHVDLATTSVAVAAVAEGTGATVAPVADITFTTEKSKSTPIVVTAQNGQTKTYTLTVYRDWNDAGLTLAVGTKPVPYDAGAFEYNFPYGSIKSGDSITFTPTYAAGGSYEAAPRSTDASSISVSDKATSLKVTFEEDPDSTYRVKITVTAPNGTTENEYTLYLSEADPVFLDDLDIMIGSSSTSKDLDFTMLPATFDEKTFAYYVFVPWDDSSAYKDGVDVYLKAAFDDSDYTVKCNTTTSLSDGSFKNVGTVLDGEDELFTVTITEKGADGNSQDYKVYIFYSEKNADNDASLDDLYVKYGSSYKTEATLSPDFSSSTYNYTATLPVGTKSAKITLKLSDSGAIVLCNGEKASSTITVSNLKTGANTYKIVVMAEDYDTTKTYNLTINVGTGGLLTNLVFTASSGSINVSPGFSGDVYNYIANVGNGVSAIYVTPTAIDSTYTIAVYKGASDYKTVTSGKTSSAITLNEGLNEIKIYVYKSGSSKTYTLSVYRQPAATKYQVSSQAITVNGVAKSLYAVNINGNNFLKLRDLAYMLTGTTKQFNVTFSTTSNTAAITSLTAYVNDPSNPVNQPIVLSNPQLSSQLVTLNGKATYPIAYNVAGSNYVNLRQICAMLDIGLTYSAATNTIAITTGSSYTPGM